MLRYLTVFYATIIVAPVLPRTSPRSGIHQCSWLPSLTNDSFGCGYNTGVDILDGLVHCMWTVGQIHDLNIVSQRLYREKPLINVAFYYPNIERQEFHECGAKFSSPKKPSQCRPLVKTADGRNIDPLKTKLGHLTSTVVHPFQIVEWQFGFTFFTIEESTR